MNIKNFIKYIMPTKILTNMLFHRYHGRFIDYQKPQLLDEKLMILTSNYYNNPLVSKCTDKYEVRQYIEEKQQKAILNELIAVYDRVEDIEWDKLPKKMVIKCTHGSHYNILVKDKECTSEAETRAVLKKWMKENYAWHCGEKQYKSIVPRIVVEKYLENSSGQELLDYKFFVSKGNIIGCLVATETGKVFVNSKFEDTKYVIKEVIDNIEKPASWNEMLKIAASLGDEFPFVRVDLYDVNGKVIFGELTFTPSSCLCRYFTDEAQRCIGEKIEL